MLKNIEVPRPYHLEIDGKVYNLSWLQFVLQVIGGLAFLVGLYAIWIMLVLASQGEDYEFYYVSVSRLDGGDLWANMLAYVLSRWKT